MGCSDDLKDRPRILPHRALGSDLVFCFRQDPGLDSGNLFPQLLILGRLSPDSTSQVADALRSSRSQPSRELWQGCRNRPPGRPRRCRPREVFFPSLGKDLGINPAVSGHSCRHRFRLDRTRSSRPRDLVGIWRRFHRLANAVGKTLPAQRAAGHGPRRGDFRRRLEAWRHGVLEPLRPIAVIGKNGACGALPRAVTGSTAPAYSNGKGGALPPIDRPPLPPLLTNNKV